MRLSKLRKEIDKAIEKFGDLEIACEYICADCDDTHEGNGFRVMQNSDGLAELSVIEIWEDCGP